MYLPLGIFCICPCIRNLQMYFGFPLSVVSMRTSVIYTAHIKCVALKPKLYTKFQFFQDKFQEYGNKFQDIRENKIFRTLENFPDKLNKFQDNQHKFLPEPQIITFNKSFIITIMGDFCHNLILERNEMMVSYVSFVHIV